MNNEDFYLLDDCKTFRVPAKWLREEAIAGRVPHLSRQGLSIRKRRKSCSSALSNGAKVIILQSKRVTTNE